MTARFTENDNDSIEWTDAKGVVWSTKLSGDGQIPGEVMEWLRAGNSIAPFVSSAAPAPRLPKLLVIDRLQAAGKFTAALAVLQVDLLTYERWSASVSVDPANLEVIALLDAIGADKSVILAPE